MPKFGNHYWVAILSLLLYSSLLVVTIHQFYVIRNRRISKFKDFKLIFLGILAVSAALSLPLWGVCAILGGPHDCQWQSGSYAFCWSLHLLALVGYSTSIGIPTIMWSDIVNGVDSQSFLKSFSTSQIDSTRICFITFVTSYVIIELITIISMAVMMSPSHMNDYFENNEIYQLSILLEPFIICFFAGGCLLIGIRLQLYVRSVRFDQFTQRRLLFQLNTVLAIVTICYMLRSILVFNLRIQYMSSNLSYVAWIACTHWAPQVICSFCLVIIMTRSRTADNNVKLGKYYAMNSEGLLSPDQMTTSDQSSPFLHFSDDEDLDYQNSFTEGDDDYASSQSDFLYNQETKQHSCVSPSQRRRSESQESRSRLQHDFSVFNPYVMTSDDGNESVLSDDIHPIDWQHHDFGTPIFDM